MSGKSWTMVFFLMKKENTLADIPSVMVFKTQFYR